VRRGAVLEQEAHRGWGLNWVLKHTRRAR
jgi:hypothetical protein